MLYSYNWLQSFFYKKLPTPKKLAALLTGHFAEVEGVKREGRDFILDVDVRPNRASDCFSHIGVAREIAAILDYKIQIPVLKLKEDKELKTKEIVSIMVKSGRDCPRYTARVIKDIKVGPSPKWLQERLGACGLGSVNNVVDVANYIMLETGQPLHLFDFDKIQGREKNLGHNSQRKEIIVRRGKKGEKILTLEGEEYELDKDILIIADPVSPLAIAGIKGGKKAEIDEDTKNIVLESANFNPRLIRAGSRKIDLKTDASWRFEHGIDPNLTETAIDRAAGLIQKLSGGRVAAGVVDFYPKKAVAKKIKLNLVRLNNLLGIDIPKKEVIAILKRLGFKAKSQKAGAGRTGQTTILEVEVPTFRLDVLIAEDLIEEVGRIYGYEKIPPQFPTAALIPPKRNLALFWENRAKDILSGIGFNEVYNYSFISQRDVDIFQFKNVVELENPISADFRYLRPSLIANLLKDIQKNQSFFKTIRVFELGRVFESPLPNEKRMLAGAMTGDVFFEAKGAVESLLNKMGISDAWYDDYRPKPEEGGLSMWHQTRRAEVKIGERKIGFLGEVCRRVLDKLGINGRVVVFDIDFEKLEKLASEEQEYRPISKYPAAIRDLAVLVPIEVKVVDILNKINAAGGELVNDVDLFDIYEGDEIPQGKKSLAFHIIYQSSERPLSSKEIDSIQREIIQSLEEEPEWEVRK